ncbi:hypothetical protein EJ03DRAFT_324643 [Teratosphaeria nubilosa]|uniref:Uncharacterized protein n=1 Tax=Teratosphaeria nubilosa TaxID=161662 RepID=A0A6G1LJ52_9PEZI|nr:hypothetical protein EJ03DRAFT_324643 [Teratosphaeria nubilosa]
MADKRQGPIGDETIRSAIPNHMHDSRHFHKADPEFRSAFTKTPASTSSPGVLNFTAYEPGLISPQAPLMRS